jgi:hypothetical protein
MEKKSILEKAYIKATDNMAAEPAIAFGDDAAIDVIKLGMQTFLKAHDAEAPEEEIVGFIKKRLKEQAESELDYTIEGENTRI